MSTNRARRGGAVLPARSRNQSEAVQNTAAIANVAKNGRQNALGIHATRRFAQQQQAQHRQRNEKLMRESGNQRDQVALRLRATVRGNARIHAERPSGEGQQRQSGCIHHGCRPGSAKRRLLLEILAGRRALEPRRIGRRGRTSLVQRISLIASQYKGGTSSAMATK